MTMEPSDALRGGRRRLESISGYELLEDLFWDNLVKRWIFKFKLTGDYTPTELVPSTTVWFCHVSSFYPNRELEIYPDAAEGIKVTFPHMTFNRDIGKRWLNGNICVKTTYGKWGKVFFNSEPFDENSRLYWNIRRAQAWVRAAAEGTIVDESDPFELPSFTTKSKPIWAFNETQHLFSEWLADFPERGIVRYIFPEINPNIAAVKEFEAKKKRIIKYNWGNVVSNDKGKEHMGLWHRLPRIPVLEPWQMPVTWAELFGVCNSMGVDLKSWLFQQLGDNLLLGKAALLALGFPVSETFGGQSNRMHWFATMLNAPKAKLTGFRIGSVAHSSVQAKIICAPGANIPWLQTENWAKDQIISRGSISSGIQSNSIAIIGGGALGSAMGELLGRLSCEKITFIDNDGASVGNFSRHTLTMESLTAFKAEKLAQRLNGAFPFLNATFKNSSIEECIQAEPEFLNVFDLIIDATANDGCLIALANALSGKDKLLVSLSTSYDAKRMYCFTARTQDIDIIEVFTRLMQPWYEKQRQEQPDVVSPMEGIGCWHPVFPARLDDIWSVLSPAIRIIESFANSSESHCLTVVERQTDGSTSIVKNL